MHDSLRVAIEEGGLGLLLVPFDRSEGGERPGEHIDLDEERFDILVGLRAGHLRPADEASPENEQGQAPRSHWIPSSHECLPIRSVAEGLQLSAVRCRRS
jgi:hypothetical protein